MRSLEGMGAMRYRDVVYNCAFFLRFATARAGFSPVRGS